MTVIKRKQEDIVGEIQEILKKIGVNYLMIGAMYLEEAIKIVYENSDSIYQCREKVYGIISEKHNVTRASVEVSLGYEVKRIREQRSIENLKEYFGESIDNRREALKPAEIIGTLAEYLHIQDNPQSLESRISKMLIKLGVLPSKYGAKYLREIIQMVYEKSEVMCQCLEEVYKQVAKRYNTTGDLLRSRLDYEAEQIRKQKGTEVLKEYFGKSIDNRKDILTLGEIIAGLAEYLHIQDNPQSLQSRISSVLVELGIFPNTYGAIYLRESIGILYSKSMMGSKQILKVYKCVATKYDSSEETVERDIRNTIEHAWMLENQEMISEYFGNVSSTVKKRPTNGQFIARIVDHLYLQDAKQTTVIHKITRILNEIGIGPQTAGYEYLRKAIEKGYEAPNTILNYAVQIQGEYKQDNINIALLVNNAILRAWQHISENVFEKYFKHFGEKYFKREKKPKNTDFIIAIVYYLRVEDVENS